MKPIYVFGHKSPDTDSVCSAISLAYLKNQKGINCVPKVIGPVNRETKFVLEYFGVDTPSYLNDTKVQIKDTKFVKKAYVNENASIDNAFNCMKKFDLTAIPLVDDNKVLTGYVTLKNLAKYLVSDKRDEIKTNLKNRDKKDIEDGNFVKPLNAIEIDTTNLNLDESLEIMLSYIKE